MVKVCKSPPLFIASPMKETLIWVALQSDFIRLVMFCQFFMLESSNHVGGIKRVELSFCYFDGPHAQ